MKILKITVITILVFVSAFLTLGIISPNSYKVERSIVINASTKSIRSNVLNLENMQLWSPWSIKDSSCKVTTVGHPDKVRAIVRWNNAANEKIAEQEIISIEEYKMEVELRFYKPTDMTNQLYAQISEVDGGVRVTLVLKGGYPFPKNAFMALLNMNQLIGVELEQGLGQLKVICE